MEVLWKACLDSAYCIQFTRKENLVSYARTTALMKSAFTIMTCLLALCVQQRRKNSPSDAIARHHCGRFHSSSWCHLQLQLTFSTLFILYLSCLFSLFNWKSLWHSWLFATVLCLKVKRFAFICDDNWNKQTTSKWILFDAAFPGKAIHLFESSFLRRKNTYNFPTM